MIYTLFESWEATLSDAIYFVFICWPNVEIFIHCIRLKHCHSFVSHCNKTCVSTSEELQTPLETVQNWRKTFGIWKGRPVKAQPEIEGVNNPYQGWFIDPLVKPDILCGFFSKSLATGAVRFSFIVAFRRYQVWLKSVLWKGTNRRNETGPYHDLCSLVL